MIKAVIFDMDGVLIDTEKWLNIYWQQAAKEAGFHFTREHGLAIRSLATKYTGPYLQKIFGPEFDYEAIRARRKQLMKEHIEKYYRFSITNVVLKEDVLKAVMDLRKLSVLDELILGSSAKTYALTELVLGTKIPMLRKLEVVNYTNLPSLDLSGCNRLEEVNASGCTKMSTITFAEGALINKLHLPENFQTLVLRSMQYIEWDAITFDAKNNLTGLWIENCALIDGKKVFDEMFALKGALKYVRITGINLEGDGSDLKVWYDSGIADQLEAEDHAL
jgi:hypothetical protein